MSIFTNIHATIQTYLQTKMFTLKMMPIPSQSGGGGGGLKAREYISALKVQVGVLDGMVVEATAKRQFEDVVMLKNALGDAMRELMALESK